LISNRRLCLTVGQKQSKKEPDTILSVRSCTKSKNKLIKPKSGMRIYDPTCGSGGMIIQSKK